MTHRFHLSATRRHRGTNEPLAVRGYCDCGWADEEIVLSRHVAEDVAEAIATEAFIAHLPEWHDTDEERAAYGIDTNL